MGDITVGRQREAPQNGIVRGRDIALMAIHKKILEWQAAHPNITWIGWGIVWAIVLAILLWPRRSG
jgi:hypothetical protein